VSNDFRVFLQKYDDGEDLSLEEQIIVAHELTARVDEVSNVDSTLFRQAISFMRDMAIDRGPQSNPEDLARNVRAFLEKVASADVPPGRKIRASAALLTGYQECSQLDAIVMLIRTLSHAEAVDGIVALKIAVIRGLPGAAAAATSLAEDKSLDRFFRDELLPANIRRGD
jgi:hypothetical protein